MWSQGSDDAPMEKPSGVDDGTFWMDYTHFLMGFQVLDVCFAHRGWHAKSLPNKFPPSADKTWRLCSTAYTVSIGNQEEAATAEAIALSSSETSGNQTYQRKRQRSSKRSVTLYISILQPTKRGSRNRSDRKKSYRPGDCSIVVYKTTKAACPDADFAGAPNASAAEEASAALLSSDSPQAAQVVAAHNGDDTRHARAL